MYFKRPGVTCYYPQMSIGSYICYVQCGHYTSSWTKSRALRKVTRFSCPRQTTLESQTQSSSSVTGLLRLLIQVFSHQRDCVNILPGALSSHGPLSKECPSSRFVVQHRWPLHLPLIGSIAPPLAHSILGVAEIKKPNKCYETEFQVTCITLVL